MKSKKENVTEDKELSKIKIYPKQYNILFYLFLYNGNGMTTRAGNKVYEEVSWRLPPEVKIICKDKKYST